MEISFCSHPSTNKVIATKFGTWHDSWAVVACAKFCCDMINCNWIRAKWIFHRIWIVMEKLLVKWVPDVFIGGTKCTKGRQAEEKTDIFTRTFKVVREIKLRSFQFKLVHMIKNIKKLFDTKIKASPQCSYCDKIDDISHFFSRCPNVWHLWYLFLQMWNGREYQSV